MSGAYDYAPLIYNMALGAYIQNDRCTMSALASLKVGDTVQFFNDPGGNLPAGVLANTEYYIYSVNNSVDYFLKKVSDNAYMAGGSGTPLNGNVWAAILPRNHGDSVWKPKLTKDQLTRSFPLWGDSYKAPPAASHLESGFTYDGVTGTYAGAAPPATTDVRDGVVYADGSLTGELDLPSVGNVKAGVQFDGESKTGTFTTDAPAVEDVRQGVGYDANFSPKMGTLDLPAESSVKAGTNYDNAAKTGTYTPDLPAADELKINATCGVGDPGGPVTGTYAGETLFPPQCVHSGLAPQPQKLEISLA